MVNRIGEHKYLIIKESFLFRGTKSDICGTNSEYRGTFSEFSWDKNGIPRDKNGVDMYIWDRFGQQTGQIRNKQ